MEDSTSSAHDLSKDPNERLNPRIRDGNMHFGRI
ncbi:hypothetical protein OROMI_006124 [Orobanche minor]